ncbi:MAG: PadR family transcriptional regulator [Rhodoglobus sp.]
MISPLSSPSFWILTILTDQRRHGYEILQEVGQVSDGRVTLKVTTLYAALERLERELLIRNDGEEIVNGRARRYYCITEKGSAALAAEVTALEQQTQVARARLVALGHSLASLRAVSA